MNKYEKLVYINERGQSIEFSVFSSFFIEKTNGLDGLKNTIYTSKSMGQDGVSYVASTIETRDITINGAIVKDKEFNREKLIAILNPKLNGKLVYINKDIKKYINCRIEQSPVITRDSVPRFLIQFYCLNPFWQEDEIKTDIALWKDDFHFPLIIPKTTGIIMGHREPSLIVNIENNGNVACGMRIEFRARATLENPSLFNINTREFIKINKEMKAGEKIIIDTNFGNKKIIDELNGVTTNAINYIDLDSAFLQLDVGDNVFRYNADKNIDNLEVTIYKSPQYLGV
ncbi:phage tail family protein [Clostridium botulinum C]|uniref:phage tail family protein n=1 Tax=Clostridium botulinum TaxID=1491 RepID=UPI001E343861|nr:phage tail family protein [Clostridium botulinum C]